MLLSLYSFIGKIFGKRYLHNTVLNIETIYKHTHNTDMYKPNEIVADLNG